MKFDALHSNPSSIPESVCDVQTAAYVQDRGAECRFQPHPTRGGGPRHMPSTMAAVFNYSGNDGSFHTISPRNIPHQPRCISLRSVACRLPRTSSPPAAWQLFQNDDHAQGKERCLSLNAIPGRYYRQTGSRFAAQRVAELTSDHTLVSLRMRQRRARFPRTSSPCF